MANSYNINTSQYQPFTFEEMLKPVLMADTEHKNIQAALGEIDAKRALVEGALDEKRDEQSYNTNVEYLNNLNKISSALASNGLQSVNRDQLNKLRTDYASKIIPIEKGIASRSKLAQLESQLDAKDKSMIYQKRAQDMSIDDFVQDPDRRPLNVSGNQLYSTSASAFSNLAKRIHSEGMLPSQAAGYLKNYVSRGYTEDQALKAMLGNEGYKQFQDIFNNVAQSYGLDKWEEGAPKDAAMENIYRGALHAIGVDDYKYMGDKEFIEPVRQASSGGGDQPDAKGVLFRTIEKEQDLSIDQRKNVEKLVTPIMKLVEDTKDIENYDYRRAITENEDYSKAIRTVYNLPVGSKIPAQYIPTSQGELDNLVENAKRKIAQTTYKVKEHVYNIKDPKNQLDILAQNIGVQYSDIGISKSEGFQNTKTKKTLSEQPTDIKEITNGKLGRNLTIQEVLRLLGSVKDTKDGQTSAALSLNELEDDFRLTINGKFGTKVLRVPAFLFINQQYSKEDMNLGMSAMESRKKARFDKDYDGVYKNTARLFDLADAGFNTRVAAE